MICFCDKELIWGGDHDGEDYCYYEDGIVSNYSCQNKECEVDTVLVYTDVEEE
mgnify:CR=1 FL=1